MTKLEHTIISQNIANIARVLDTAEAVSIRGNVGNTKRDYSMRISPTSDSNTVAFSIQSGNHNNYMTITFSDKSIEKTIDYCRQVTAEDEVK